MKDNFVLYLTYYDAVMLLTDEQAGQLLKGLYEFAKTGERREYSDPTIRFAYSLITAQIEASNKQYEDTCQRNRENIMKRWNTKNKVVNDNIRPNTTEYDGIRPNTTEYEEKIRIPKIDRKKEKIDSKKDNKEEDEKKKDELSLFAPMAANSSKELSSDVFALVMRYWNDSVEAHGSAMKKIQAMTDRRKSAVRARLREHGNSVEVMKDMIKNAVTSDFLNGRNSRNKIFTFDALFAPDMFQKTLEGNFNDRGAAGQAGAGQRQSGIGKLIEQQQQDEPQQDRQAQQRERFEQMIEAVRKNPNHRCRAILEGAARNGTLKALGISWEPSTNENNKND